MIPGLLVLLFGGTVGMWAAQEDPPAKPSEDRVLATVDSDTITAAEVERELSIALGERTVSAEQRAELSARMLELLTKRRLVMRWLNKTGQSATPAEIDLAVDQLRMRLKQQGITLHRYLNDQRLDEQGLRRSLSWQISWDRYLARQLTDDNLQRYFDKHRRDFDGTQLRVAQILWRAPPTADAQQVAAAQKKAAEQAAEVLTEIRSGKISFGDAARKYSDSPSAEQGGNIGLISRHEPMPEPFSKAAFALEPGQVSEPVVTPLGVHLIQCLEILPGQKRWTDVRADLEQAVTQYLFDWSADQTK